MGSMIFLRDGLAWIIGSVGMLVGQAVPTSVGTIIQGGAFAVLAYAFLHMVVKTLPSFQKCQEEQQAAFMAALERAADRAAKDDAGRDTTMRQLTQAITDLRIHCAAKDGK